MQERLTNQIANTILETIKPMGVAVVMGVVWMGVRQTSDLGGAAGQMSAANNPASASCYQWTGHNNNYIASRGTTTDPGANDSTGVFARVKSYGIQAVTDGTSNTIAFSEGLVSANGIS